MYLLTRDDHGRPVRRADLPWNSGAVIVLRDEAIEVVGDVLRGHGEILPLECWTARLALFSPPLVSGVLDEDRSDLLRFDSGRIMMLKRPAFDLSKLGGIKAFRLAQMPRNQMYLTQSLVEELLATGMTSGTEFVPVDFIDSETT